MFYSGGERGLHKQGHIIHKALNDIPNVELIELKNLKTMNWQKPISGDYFVSWEMEGGFSIRVRKR